MQLIQSPAFVYISVRESALAQEEKDKDED